jgi:hypothetical protein
MSKMLEVLELAVAGEGGYAIPAAVLYPAMLPLVDSDLQPTLPGDDDRRHYERLLAKVRAMRTAITDAGLPVDEVTDPSRRAARAEVLEACRLWFTAELHAAYKDAGRMRLHISIEWKKCDACNGTGKVEAGTTGIMVDCPVCGGAGSFKVPSPWRL